MAHTIIIAEIGECFNGSIARAEKMMKLAKESGCDFVKFQTLDYQAISINDPEREWFKKIALTPERIAYLIRSAKEIEIDILFSPENEKTCRWLVDLKCKDVKIASSSVSDLKLVKFVNQNFKRVFVSTGMSSLKEVKSAVKHLNKIPDLYILHCVSEYPTGPLLKERGLRALRVEDTRLNMMRMLMQIFPQYKIGYSDHTCQILPPVAAVAMGAQVIEKHFTLNRKVPIEHFESGREYLGTDHVLSLEPRELQEMVSQIRQVEKMFGPWRWERTKGENVLRDFIRGRFGK